jgi:hypothetical protein
MDAGCWTGKPINAWPEQEGRVAKGHDDGQDATASEVAGLTLSPCRQAIRTPCEVSRRLGEQSYRSQAQPVKASRIDPQLAVGGSWVGRALRWRRATST